MSSSDSLTPKTHHSNRFPIKFQLKVHFFVNSLAPASEQVVFTTSVRDCSRERCEH